MSRRRRSWWARLAPLVLMVAGGWILVRNAWLGDDAYISFRVVDNLVHGYGLRYNVLERVQAFTNPLWVLLLVPFHLALGNIYAVALALSLALSLAALWTLTRIGAERLGPGLLAAACLLASRSFVDYSTSGLENCLTNALLAAFALVLLRGEERAPSARRLGLLFLLGGLLATNRLDLAVLVLPPLALVLWRARSLRALGVAALGLTPLVAWELFALVYYGFPFPNTAYAKLGTGTPRAELLGWGVEYLRASAEFDPFGVLFLLLGLALPLGSGLRGARRELALGAGSLLYLGYVVWAGGDFMAGRFLAGPLVLAAAVVARRLPARPRLLPHAGVAAAVLVALLAPHGTARTGPGERDEPALLRRKLGPRGSVADERSHYWAWSNPLLDDGQGPWPYPDLARLGEAFRAKGQSEVKALEMAGVLPYCCGPALHVVDAFALADPLLARLPMPEGKRDRPGHYRRWMPLGYLRTIAEGRDLLVDRDLAAYYEELCLVTRGPLFAAERWRAIWELNTGGLDERLDPRLYGAPDRAEFRRRHQGR